MKYIKEEKREIPVIAEPDILVVGAGPAGIGAAIAAARNGAKTLLIEKYGFIGGNLTIAMVNPFFTFHDINGRQVIRGIAGEVVDRLVDLNMSDGHTTDLTFDNASMTTFDPEGMKIVLLRMVKESGADMLLHAQVVGATRKDNNVDAVIIESKSGRQAILPKYVIDCSADADIVSKIGAPFIMGRREDGLMQPVSLFFRIGGINNHAMREWMKQNRNLLKDSPTDEEIDSQEAIAFLGMKDLIKQAMDKGDFPLNAAPRILFYQLTQRDQVAVNVTRLQGIDGTNVHDLTRAEIETREQAWGVYKFLKKYIGGFEQSYILDTGVQVGVRETRHIVGDYELTEDDVLTSKAFADGIACGAFAIDIHPPQGEQQVFSGSGKSVYEIPYRCLLPQGVDNLWVAGRCICATHAAFGSARVMATAMAMGQGAGVAAAIATELGIITRQIDVSEVRKKLIEQGQYLLNAEIKEVKSEKLILKRAEGSGANASHHNPFKSKGL
jgi:hypothetical protein